MELRQLRYFVRVVELGSISRAALDLQLVQSALSQQISRLESELATRLLQRSSKGVTATEAGLAFFREAQLALRHADEAARAAQQSRLSGSVSVGLAPTTASVLGLPLMQAVRERYPDVRLELRQDQKVGKETNQVHTTATTQVLCSPTTTTWGRKMFLTTGAWQTGAAQATATTIYTPDWVAPATVSSGVRLSVVRR